MFPVSNLQTFYGTRNQFKCNTAIRLSYSLQLLPCYNEKIKLTPVNPTPPARSFKMRRTNQRQSVQENSSYSILWLPVVILSATLGLYGLSRAFLQTVGNGDLLKFPTSIEDIRDMTDFLQTAKEEHPVYLLILFSAAYVYKQSFAVPGSVFLNLLAGALFGPYIAFPLTCTLTAIGATSCYMLSSLFGKSYVVKYFPQKVRFFQEKVESNRDNLFFFLLFLRLFPMSPNWAINMISPIVGVPVHLFFASVFVGLMPYNFICVQTGDVLSQISSVNDILDVWTMAKMAAVAIVALLPILIKKFHLKDD